MKASVLINNYNYGLYVEKAVVSALNQTYNDVEIIIYDDGSTDNSLEILNKYAHKIQILACKNYGKGHCWNQINSINEAFRRSTGDIIFLMDSDDWFYENKVEKMMNIFLNNPDVICVQHGFQVIDDQNIPLTREKRPLFSGIDILKEIYFVKRLDFFFTQTSGQSYRRSFLEKILPLQEDELSMICVDIRLTRYAAFEGKIVTLTDKLAAYRMHSKNHSLALKDKNYYINFQQQHIQFFNNLALHYNYPLFKAGNIVWSYLKVLVLLLKSEMTFKQKKNFIQVWYKSYMK